MGDNVKPINHHAEWIQTEKKSAPSAWNGCISPPRQGARGCFREFALLSFRKQPEAGVTDTQAKSVL